MISFFVVVFLPILLILGTQLTGLGSTRWKNFCAKLLRKVINKNRIFEYTVIDDGIILGALPKTEEDINSLVQDQKVTGIITMNMGWEISISTEQIRKAGAEHLHLPTPDFSAVSQSDLIKGVEFMEKHISSSGTVYVHCNAGKGRSTSVVLCYLIKKKSMPKLEAYNFCKAKRKIAKFPALCGTRPQWRAIGTYEKRINKDISKSPNKEVLISPNKEKARKVVPL